MRTNDPVNRFCVNRLDDLGKMRDWLGYAAVGLTKALITICIIREFIKGGQLANKPTIPLFC